MIDFLKLETYDAIQIDCLFNHTLLHWVSDTDRLKYLDKEVITTKTIKHFKGIYFHFYSNKLEILFKPHYYFNDNVHNANDFNIKDCVRTIKEVKNALNIDATMFKVINIEYGLNIISPIDIRNLINYLAYHSKNEFRTDTGLPFSKKSYSVKPDGTANEYKIIKAYAKGIQFPLYTDINTFRFEVKSKKSRFINSFGIISLNDLLDVNVYFSLKENLIIEFNDVLIFDCETNFSSLNLKEQNKIIRFNNHLHWFKIRGSNNRNSFSKNKIEYNRLINKIPNNLKSQLVKIIFDKLELLKKGAISPPQNKSKKGAISPLYNRGICTQNKTIIVEVKNHLCKVTGLSLSNEKIGAKYILTTTLKIIRESDPITFELVKINALKNSYFKPKFERSEIAHIAKQIRNEYYNKFKIKHQGYKQPLSCSQPIQINLFS